MISRKTILLLGLISALSVSLYLIFSIQTSGIGFPLDDAWIHQTYARNLATGYGWSFVAGESSAGLTAPLWGLLLAFGSFLGLGPYFFTFLMGWLTLWALAVTGSYGFLIFVPGKEKWALAAGSLLALEWHLVWAAVSGMETLHYALIVLVVLVLLIRRDKKKKDPQFLLIGLLIGLSIWIRPEGLTLLGPLIFVILFNSETWKIKGNQFLVSLWGFSIIFVPYVWFNRWLAGDWWPNTFYAKQAEYAILKNLPLWERLFQQFSLPMIGVGILLLPGLIFLTIRLFRKKEWSLLAMILWFIGHLSIYALRLPVTYQHGRYAIPAMPVYFLLAFSGFALMIDLYSNSFMNRILNKTWAIAIPLVTILFLIIGGNSYRQDVGVINSQMVNISKWVSANIPNDQKIAAHDIGALGYFSNRPILDLAGLISPDVIPIIRNESELANYLNINEITYLITFPSWYPQLISGKSVVYVPQNNTLPGLEIEDLTIYCWNCFIDD